MHLPVLAAISLLGSSLFLAGCDAPVSAPPAAPSDQVTRDRPRSQPLADRQREVEFLNRIRRADSQGSTIERALLNEQNELGLILNRSVPMAKIPDLMRSILTQMAREFPGQDLTVIAYTPSNPPHKIGTAQLNAQTADMTYTPVR